MAALTVLTSPKTYTLLAAFQAGDSVACAIPLAAIEQNLRDLGIPAETRWVMAAVKVASVPGLLSVRRRPALARLTTAMLTLYFTLALGAHIRAHDKPVNAVPAAGFLATYALLTAKGPNVQ